MVEGKEEMVEEKEEMVEEKEENDVNAMRKDKIGINSLRKVIDSIDPRLARVFLPFAFRHPGYIRSFIRLSRSFRRCCEARKNELEKGIMVPPFLILSVTSRCNLGCSGCYARATGAVSPIDKNHDSDSCSGESDGIEYCHEEDLEGSFFSGTQGKGNSDLDLNDWKSIIAQASELGIFGFVIAGGEPFLIPGILDLCLEFKDRLFLILTNGTAIGPQHMKHLKKCSNAIIIVSLEGDQDITDSRRGTGVHARVMQTLEALRNAGVLTGISVTITSKNVDHWLMPDYLESLVDQDIKLVTFIEYIPLSPTNSGTYPSDGISHFDGSSSANEMSPQDDWDDQDDHHLMLTPEKRKEFRSYVLSMRSTLPMYIIHSPGDEEYFGGCVSAGRGFAHVTPRGDLTPCPVSNIATHNLSQVPVRDALAGKLFDTIRDNHHLLETDGMPCALFAHPREVDELACLVGAYRTNVRSK